MAETLAAKRALVERLAKDAPAKHRRFIVRAVMERGLTEEDILWNTRLNRPMIWIETVHPEEELKRRAEWTRRNPPVVVIA